MMKWPLSGTSRGLSKILKGFMALVLIKLVVIVFMVVGASLPSVPDGNNALSDSPISAVDLGGAVFSVRQASAQTGDAADSGSSGMSTDGADDGSAEGGQAEAGLSGSNLERETLLRRQEELDRREQALNALEAEIDAKLVRLQELEASIQRLVDDARGVMDENLRHLIDVYSNMKAKQAAQVLETLDEEIAVKILAGMNGRVAGEILSNVQSEKAARLTELLTRMQAPY